MGSYKGMANSWSFRHSRAPGRRRSPRGQRGADGGCGAVPERRGRGIAPRGLNSQRRGGACAFPKGTEGAYRRPDPLLSMLGVGTTQKGRPPPPPSAGGVWEPRRDQGDPRGLPDMNPRPRFRLSGRKAHLLFSIPTTGPQRS